MAAFSRGLKLFGPTWEPVYIRYLPFSTTAGTQSGHSRWSKIKHDKGAVDAKKNVQRSVYAREIALCSKLYGGDINHNHRLAALCANARKAGFPKASMDAAIARGQGKSTTGAVLKALSLEVILPSTVAMIIEVETDNVARTQMELRMLIKWHKGTVTPTSYLFQKRGQIIFEKDAKSLKADDVLDEAIEAGAEDVEETDGGNIVVWTDAGSTTATAEKLKESLGLKVGSMEIVWDRNEDTSVRIDEVNAQSMSALLEALDDNSEVQAVYANVLQGELSDEAWGCIEDKLAA
ncbi:transcriptional regulator TACO1-like protein [Calycina marina]|uniref:Transcriptional regulator TACO1-like protein n=1 Tax=Calycina marina TaxID=1763456 RepID=A0A9P8CDR8_9HELO|nr:transcriptional regulator TACO1-like protein [Calycina marina]